MLAATDLDIQPFMQVLVTHMQALTQATGAVIELLEGDEMVYTAACGSVAPYIGLRLKAQGSLSGMCVRTGLVTYSKDTSNDPRVDEAACKKVNARSMIVVPLKDVDRVVGVLKTVSDQVYAFGAYDIQALELLADLLGEALGRQMGGRH